MAMKLHLRHTSVHGTIPSGCARVEDNQPEGRWELVEEAEDFNAGARLNGYNLILSANVLPEGATFRCGKRVITLRDGHYYTPEGKLTNPRMGEKG